MKTLLSILIVIFSLSSHLTLAKQKVDKVEVKCHVELYGGGETVHFRKLKKDKLTKLEQRLVNKKINVAKMKAKQTIYKVIECVSLDKEFSTFQSKGVDKNTAR
jgi:hypothetical protein